MQRVRLVVLALLMSGVALAGCMPPAQVRADSAGAFAALDAGPRARHFSQVKKLAYLSPQVFESSGLTLVANQIWTINDSGGGPWLYQLETSGQVVRRVRVAGAENVDWEALASDERWLYVADCGNNSGRRTQLQIYRVALAQLLRAAEGGSVSSERIDFSFADAAPVSGVHKHDNDCEAMTLVDGQLWLLTKGWDSLRSRLYRLDPKPGQQRLLTVAELPVRGLVTDVDYSPVRKELAILGYTGANLLSEGFVWRVPVTAAGVDWPAARRYSLWPSGQWEGIAWQGDRLLLTREQSPLGDAWLAELPLEGLD